MQCAYLSGTIARHPRVKGDIAADDSCGAHPQPGQVQEAKEGVGEAVEGSGVRVVSVHRGNVKNFPRRSDAAVSNAQHTPGGVTDANFIFFCTLYRLSGSIACLAKK